MAGRRKAELNRTETHPWTARHEEAAHLIAEGELGYPEIARRLGVARSVLWEWRQRPDFAERVEHLRQARFEEIERDALLNRRVRLLALSRVWTDTLAVMRLRAITPEAWEAEVNTVPGAGLPTADRLLFPRGAETGLVAYSVKRTPRGGRSVEQAYDKGLVEALLKLDERAARYGGEPWATRAGAANGGIYEDGAAQEVAEAGTTFTLTPRERARMLLDLVKDDPEYAARARELLAD
jgi:hypothetical protein